METQPKQPSPQLGTSRSFIPSVTVCLLQSRNFKEEKARCDNFCSQMSGLVVRSYRHDRTVASRNGPPQNTVARSL
eukprot:155724-Amphidinium_carterae.1